MTRWQDLSGYWQTRAIVPYKWLPHTRREVKRALKVQRHGRRMRPPIKGLKYYDASRVRIFIGGVELDGSGFESVNYLSWGVVVKN